MNPGQHTTGLILHHMLKYMLKSGVCLHACALRNNVPYGKGCHMRRQVAFSFQAGRSTPVAQGPSMRTQWDSNSQPLNTCVSRGAGSTTELSPTPMYARIDADNLIIRVAIVVFTDNSNTTIATAVWGGNPGPPNIMQLLFM